jgi:hypothetical protein
MTNTLFSVVYDRADGEPKKKIKGQGKTYYHVKDINFLAHEPLLEKFRQLRAYERKIKKAKAKKAGRFSFPLSIRVQDSQDPRWHAHHSVAARKPGPGSPRVHIDSGITDNNAQHKTLNTVAGPHFFSAFFFHREYKHKTLLPVRTNQRTQPN